MKVIPCSSGRSLAFQRDLNKLKNWAHGNLMGLNKSECKVLHLDWGALGIQYRLGDERIEKDLGVPVDENLDLSQQCAPKKDLRLLVEGGGVSQ